MSVIEINTGKPVSPVNDECVELLETLLAKAKSGELVALAVACASADGMTFTAIEDGQRRAELCVPIMALHYRYSKWVAE